MLLASAAIESSCDLNQDLSPLQTQSAAYIADERIVNEAKAKQKEDIVESKEDIEITYGETREEVLQSVSLFMMRHYWKGDNSDIYNEDWTHLTSNDIYGDEKRDEEEKRNTETKASTGIEPNSLRRAITMEMRVSDNEGGIEDDHELRRDIDQLPFITHLLHFVSMESKIALSHIQNSVEMRDLFFYQVLTRASIRMLVRFQGHLLSDTTLATHNTKQHEIYRIKRFGGSNSPGWCYSGIKIKKKKKLKMRE